MYNMSLHDTIFNNILFTILLKNENQKLNIFYIFCFYLFNIIYTNYKNYNIFEIFQIKENKIKFIASDKESSERFRAIMHFIIEKSDISELRELERYQASWTNDKIAYYKVNQKKKFIITDNIYGLITFKEKEIKVNNTVILKEFQYLEISSSYFNVKQIKNFIEKCNDDYIEYLKNDVLKFQLFIDILWNIQDKDIIVKSNKWKSSSTFENKFFTDKEKIIDKINFFLDNKKIYNKRGIPHTLGFLLYGDPGTGKSSFIKSIANKTGYHIINIKLSKMFDFNILYKILYNETITPNLIIPLNKRIIIFEDIDCMTDIVKNRFDNHDKLKEIENNFTKDNELSFTKKILSQLEDNENNNLSFLLNILDGVQESEDRIIIMTTNKPEKLDNALIRPGRVDIKIHFTKATIDDIKNILCNFWNVSINIINIDIDFNYKLSHADIINICKESIDLKETLNILTEKVYNLETL